MSNKLKENFPVIQLLSKIKNAKKRKNILKEIEGDQNIYDSIAEIIRNNQKGNIKLTKLQTNKLKKYNKVLKGFCCSKNKKCFKKRKNLLIQSGGVLPILIPAVASILSSLFNRA